METNEVILLGTQLKKLLELKSERIMQAHDLRIVELDILILLVRAQQFMTAKEISELKHISKAHVSKSVNNLRERGLIELEEDAEDHRKVHIKPTPRAYAIVQQEKEIYDDCRMIMWNHITTDEKDMMNQIVHKIIENLNLELEKFL